jgi:hypothetical protein
MKHLLLLVSLTVALAMSAFAVPLTLGFLPGNSLTANDTYTLNTTFGKSYTISITGNFGGGSLAVNYRNSLFGGPAAYAGSPFTQPRVLSIIAGEGDTLELVLTGATSPNIVVVITARNTPISVGAFAQLSDATTAALPTLNTPLATALAGKEPTVVAGTAAQYRRGDKTLATLDKAAVGLGNVDDTSDASKPVSTATATALATKATTSALAPVATSGSYNDLTAKPAAMSGATIATALGFTPANTASLASKAPLVSPALVTPNLGVPTAGTLTNCTGLPAATGITGVIPKANGGNGSSTAGQTTMFSDVKPNNAAGDAVASGVWQKVVLQTKVDIASNFSLTNSVITATRSGSFFVEWSVPVWQTDTTTTRLRRTNNTPATLLLGKRIFVNHYYEVTANCNASGFVYLNAGDQLELQVFARASGNTGWNITSLDGEVSIYSTMSFTSE